MRREGKVHSNAPALCECSHFVYGVKATQWHRAVRWKWSESAESL
jgi:hypothetical protein